MQVEALAVRLRPRTGMEAADLGARLCQSAARSVYTCYAVVALPVMALSLATFEIATWLPGLLLWWAKPWLDRTILFVLSRAAFGQPTTVADLWRAKREVWGRQLLSTWTWRRLSPWRSFTQPVYQLEGHRGFKVRKRVLQIRGQRSGQGLMLTGAFALAETALVFAVFSLAFWFAPRGDTPDLTQLFTGGASTFVMLAYTLSYAAAVAFVEPFYVAAGFAMYLNRRAELEAWDIEQEFAVPFSQAQIAEALAKVKADPNLATERTIRTLDWTSQSKPHSNHMPQWLDWIVELFQWLAQSARVLIWVAAGLLAALLALYIVRLVRAHGLHRDTNKFIAPSFVRDLDIRPESLPADIGVAALDLWERGEHRAALALLYRGLLSRLVHVHRVPIRDSSTEGDCLELATRHLNSERNVYVDKLVKTWQRAVYGGQDPDRPAVAALCAEFAPALNIAAEPTP